VSLPDLLRHTRARQRITQLEMALRLGVSRQQVSLLELGRTRPSRRMLLAWMDEAAAPPSFRNAALILAGFSPADAEAMSSSECLTPVRAALRQVISAHDPFAALVFDVDRYVVDMNRGARWLWTVLMPAYWSRIYDNGGMDMIDALIDPEGLFSRMRQPERAAGTFLNLLRREQWLRPSLTPRVDAYADKLRERFGLQQPRLDCIGKPWCELAFDTEIGALSFIIVQSSFGPPQDAGVDSSRLELWFPADGATRAQVLKRRGEGATRAAWTG
jgi:transcriptional regulator with XRE-family HTH domain